jgi:uncharacterized protein (UPF0333 family)
MLRRNITTNKRKKKGQSTVEYIVLVAAILGAVILFTTGTFKNAFNATLASGTNGMENMAGRLAGSRPLAP